MSTKALKKQLMAAVAMMLVAVIALSGSTFAWFAINNAVEAEGLKVTTQTSNNLFINTVAQAAGFTTMPADSVFGTQLSQVPEDAVILEPVSTVNAQTGKYFYNLTDNTKGDGQRTDTDIDYVAYDLTAVDKKGTYANNFENNYQATGAKGYVDFEYALKAVNASDAANYIKLDKLDLYYGAAKDAGKAYRVAVFYQKADADKKVAADLADGTNGTLLDIKSVNGAANFTEGKAVSAEDALGAVTMNTESTKITVAAGATEYYKVTVRLWLEGEDTTCNNTTYMDLKDNWTLKLHMTLDATATGSVQFITEYTTVVGTDTKTYYYDGTSVYESTDMETDVKASAPADVKTAFGIA